MRKYLEGIHLVGYPRVDLGTDRYHYSKMTMGDAKGKRSFSSYAFQHHIVQGYLTDDSGGNRVFMGSNMNGRDHTNRIVEKMEEPMWFEIAHAKWPDAKFDYFLGFFTDFSGSFGESVGRLRAVYATEGLGFPRHGRTKRMEFPPRESALEDRSPVVRNGNRPVFRSRATGRTHSFWVVRRKRMRS